MIRRVADVASRYRAFAAHWGMEVLVVVVGVLLALSVQQWAEDRTSRQRARDAEARIREELISASVDVAERIAVHGCLKQRLTSLADGVAKGDPDWRPTIMPELYADRLAFGRVYRVPSRNWTSSVFGGAASSGDLDHLPPERAAALSSAYGWLGAMARQNAEENQLAAELSALQFSIVRSLSERSATLSRLARLDQINSSLSVNADQLLTHLARIGIGPTDTEIAEGRRVGFPMKWVADGRTKYGPCFRGDAIDILTSRLRSGAKR